MKQPFILTAQLSTGHSLPKDLTPEKVLPALRKAFDILPLDTLIVGWEEIPDLFHALMDKEKRRANHIFLWYPMLSDYPGIKPEHLVVDYKGQQSTGWGNFLASGEMTESFRFACPNNPEALQKSLSSLEHLLLNYDFDGVFLDKIRFPSPANGLSEILACFCPHCQKAAKAQGLDLENVRQRLLSANNKAIHGGNHFLFPGASWLDNLLKNEPLIKEFVRFKCESISSVITQVNSLTRNLGKKLALDVFSPGLAPLVGQDLPIITKYAEWVKPMIYRFAEGPASLRLEIPEFIQEMSQYLQCDRDTMLQWLNRNIPEFTQEYLDQVIEYGVPLELVAREVDSILDLTAPTPIYLGIETVRIPDVIEISPEDILDIVNLAKKCNISGLVLSWDLLHTPIENLQPLKELI